MNLHQSNIAAIGNARKNIDPFKTAAPRSCRKVPEKPTTEMLAAGSLAGEVSVKTAWEIYRAMLKAAP